MQDRRHGVRDKVFMGGVAEINENGSTMDCVVRNFSDSGACVELESSAKIPDQMRVTIAHKGRSYLARMIWRQANRVGQIQLSHPARDPQLAQIGSILTHECSFIVGERV